jgi:hypothetical protein
MLRTSDTRMAEFMIAIISLAWACVMMMPGWTHTNSIVHKIMTEFLPQPVWNTLFLTVGLSGLYAVVKNDFNLRRLCAFAASGLYCFVSLAYWQMGVLLPGALIVPIYSAVSVLAYWRLGEAIRYECMRRAVLATYELVGPEAAKNGPFRRRADGADGRGISARD